LSQTQTEKTPFKRNLKGSRKLQRLNFLGGTATGTATNGGSATGTGSGVTKAAGGIANSNGSGSFTNNGGATGFVDTVFGTADGDAAATSSGSQAGTAAVITDAGTSKFAGTTTTNGAGSFGAGFSPVVFNTVITPGPLITTTSSGSSKKGGSSTTTVLGPDIVTVIPTSTGPTGGFGEGSGAINLLSNSQGTAILGVSTGSITGAGASTGGGQGQATNFFGSAGGLGSGQISGTDAAGGNSKLDATGASFTGTGSASGSFANQGSGAFGTNSNVGNPLFASLPTI